jgi:uroporphyrinogen decarboxylase
VSAGSLRGLSVVSFESRQAREMAKLVERFGGQVLSAPSLQEIPFEKNTDAFVFGEKLLAGKIDAVIFLTGVGARALFRALETRHPREALVAALSRTAVVARGPKPLRALREYGVPVAVAVPEPNTWREVLQELDEHEEGVAVEGKTVAVQEYGETNEALIEGLRRRKAAVVRVPVYRWALPDDTGPLKEGIRAIVDGRADVALFTNKVQIDHVMRVASEEGLADRLRRAFRSVVVASVGPVCTEGLVGHGVSVDLESRFGKIGSFVMEAAETAPELLRKKRAGESVRAAGAPAGGRGPAAPERLAASPFMKALALEPAGRTPVWLMRQAGRYLKEYREIRRRVSFLDLCKDPDLVAEVTVGAQEFLGADAAILFSDILLPVESFGLGLEYGSDEGPVIESAVGEGPRLADLAPFDPKEKLGFVLEAVRRTRRALAPDVPLIGFAGAPFTLASYMIEGGTSKTFRRTKMLMYREPAAWAKLLELLADVTAAFLNAQIEAGVQAVQLFDSWVGCLGPEDYRAFVLPHTARIFRAVCGAPTIHFGTGTAALLELMAEAGGSAVGVDHRVRLGEAWKRIGAARAIQGNLDPLVLSADRPFIEKRVREVLAEAGGRPGHIFNLGHGVLPETPPENAKFLVELVHELTGR